MIYYKLKFAAALALELRGMFADHPNFEFLCYLLEMVAQQCKFQLVDYDKEEAA